MTLVFCYKLSEAASLFCKFLCVLAPKILCLHNLRIPFMSKNVLNTAKYHFCATSTRANYIETNGLPISLY